MLPLGSEELSRVIWPRNYPRAKKEKFRCGLCPLLAARKRKKGTSGGLDHEKAAGEKRVDYNVLECEKGRDTMKKENKCLERREDVGRKGQGAYGGQQRARRDGHLPDGLLGGRSVCRCLAVQAQTTSLYAPPHNVCTASQVLRIRKER